MLNRRETLLALGALAAPGATRAQDSPAADGCDDFRKLEPVLEFTRKRSADDYAVATPNGVDEGRYIRAGGIEQWVTIRGEDRANPAVLLLHGGPGDATNPWGYAGFRTWLKTYTVVQWDQRGTGRTLGRNGRDSAKTIGIDRLVNDGIDVAEAVRASLRKDKIILVGHSWGSVLGVLMAKARPDLFHAYVGTGQVRKPAGSYDVAFDALLAKARESKDLRAARELEAIGPPPYNDGHGYQVQRRWSNLLEGADWFIASMMGFALNAPGYTIRDINDWLDGQILGEVLIAQARALAPDALIGRFALPVFVIQGAEDFTTPTSLAKDFVERVEAPRKAFATIKGGHFAVFMNPSAFVDELNRVVGAAAR